MSKSIELIYKNVNGEKSNLKISSFSVKKWKESGDKLIIKFMVKYKDKFKDWNFEPKKDRIVNYDDVIIFLSLNCSNGKKK